MRILRCILAGGQQVAVRPAGHDRKQRDGLKSHVNGAERDEDRRLGIADGNGGEPSAVRERGSAWNCPLPACLDLQLDRRPPARTA